MISDLERDALLREWKPLPSRYWARPALRQKAFSKSLVRTLRITGLRGSSFELELTQHRDKPRKFSLILMHTARSGECYRLLRCNGHHAGHQNKAEYAASAGLASFAENRCHVHVITERYQRSFEFDEDGYAEPTSEYDDFETAYEFLKGAFYFCELKGEQPQLQIARPFSIDTFTNDF